MAMLRLCALPARCRLPSGLPSHRSYHGSRMCAGLVTGMAPQCHHFTLRRRWRTDPVTCLPGLARLVHRPTTQHCTIRCPYTDTGANSGTPRLWWPRPPLSRSAASLTVALGGVYRRLSLCLRADDTGSQLQPGRIGVHASSRRACRHLHGSCPCCWPRLWLRLPCVCEQGKRCGGDDPAQGGSGGHRSTPEVHVRCAVV